MRNFSQVDVFSSEPLLGNPVAVVHDADGISDEDMAAFARWTNLSETTFLLTPTSDIFLGWTSGPEGRAFYWRQLRDMKFSPDLSLMEEPGLRAYAGVCGRALARSHARAGNRVAIAAYLGSGSQFSDAVADFAMAYADQAESDYAELQRARADGRLPS
jgi:hypothetical protein